MTRMIGQGRDSNGLSQSYSDRDSESDSESETRHWQGV
jgi:hypothetical protein